MKAIKEAPGYSVNDKNEIVNDKSKKVISQSNGKVRLMVDKKRKSFKVSELINKYATKTKVKPLRTEKKSKVSVKIKKKENQKLSPDELIAMGIYPYNIKDLDKIESIKESLEIEDVVQFVDYKTKRKTTGIVCSHTKFSDHYPGVRVSIGKGKEKKYKILSYLNIKKINV